jgi:hypothetical protein
VEWSAGNRGSPGVAALVLLPLPSLVRRLKLSACSSEVFEDENMRNKCRLFIIAMTVSFFSAAVASENGQNTTLRFSDPTIVVALLGAIVTVIGWAVTNIYGTIHDASIPALQRARRCFTKRFQSPDPSSRCRMVRRKVERCGNLTSRAPCTGAGSTCRHRLT